MLVHVKLIICLNNKNPHLQSPTASYNLSVLAVEVGIAAITLYSIRDSLRCGGLDSVITNTGKELIVGRMVIFMLGALYDVIKQLLPICLVVVHTVPF